MNNIAMDVGIYKEYLQLVARKKVQIMCKTLNNLAGKTPTELLIGAEAALEIPVNLKKVLKHWNVSAIPVDFTALQETMKEEVAEKGAILGAAIVKDNQVGIFYRATDTAHRQLFTIAHELAHCCLDAENLAQNRVNYRFENFSRTDVHEIAMNTFAGELLIPKIPLRRIYHSIQTPFVEELAAIFQVACTVMTERLKVLGLQVNTAIEA